MLRIKGACTGQQNVEGICTDEWNKEPASAAMVKQKGCMGRLMDSVCMSPRGSPVCIQCIEPQIQSRNLKQDACLASNLDQGTCQCCCNGQTKKVGWEARRLTDSVRMFRRPYLSSIQPADSCSGAHIQQRCARMAGDSIVRTSSKPRRPHQYKYASTMPRFTFGRPYPAAVRTTTHHHPIYDRSEGGEATRARNPDSGPPTRNPDPFPNFIVTGVTIDVAGSWAD